MTDGPTDPPLLDDLLEAWRTHQRIHRLLLAHIPEDGLGATLSTRGGRDVSRQFAHLHTQRLRWLEAKGAGDLVEGLPRFESKEQPSKEALLSALDASADALETAFREMLAGERKVKGQKKGPVVSIAYFIAHESHHRGSILLTLKQSGVTVDKKATYGIWDWHRR